ncbi:nucleotidyl transferase AbiEii/AbiGii toxin family protein [Bacteroidales bacterium OttesenSCG-928-K22]|nr:nucleotidyl transferase AbiEii/AbiGii toxin family protein [Bacteroidales bacterium OttesenSCG-928-L14]MDL2240194.1 nucleotidyl transferase AbiEii/AbiGii toxin family protein [Bacteroidales bacterium OttesenSCG-928-K22]
MNLHLNKEAFAELVELSANYFVYEKSHIEKDYWVCKILKELIQTNFSKNIYFKGGTSLSKAYGIIDRFSEDLDLFVYTGNPKSSIQSEKTLTRNISHVIIENNEGIYNKDNSKIGGDFRKLAFSYKTSYEGIGLKENLEVEIKCCALNDKLKMYYPFQNRNICSIITEYLHAIGNKELIANFELESFEVQCIDPKRTLCDKISRLTRLSYKEDFESEIAKHIRDVYDIYCLLTRNEYLEFIYSKNFVDALKQVTDEDKFNKNYPSYIIISDARIFNQTEQTLKLSAISQAYEGELKKLIFKSSRIPSINEIIETFAVLKKALLKFDTKYSV